MIEWSAHRRGKKWYVVTNAPETARLRRGLGLSIAAWLEEGQSKMRKARGRAYVFIVPGVRPEELCLPGFPIPGEGWCWPRFEWDETPVLYLSRLAIAKRATGYDALHKGGWKREEV